MVHSFDPLPKDYAGGLFDPGGFLLDYAAHLFASVGHACQDYAGGLLNQGGLLLDYAVRPFDPVNQDYAGGLFDPGGLLLDYAAALLDPVQSALARIST